MLMSVAAAPAPRSSRGQRGGKRLAADHQVPQRAQRRARPSSSASSMRAIDGVHCRCVTPWRAICAATEQSLPSAARGAPASRAAAARSRCAQVRRAPRRSATPKSIRQAISSTPTPLHAVDHRQAASRACRTGRWSRSSARRRTRAARPSPRPSGSARSTLPGVGVAPSRLLERRERPGVLLDQVERACAGTPSSARARSRAPSSSSSPTKVCSISVTWPVARMPGLAPGLAVGARSSRPAPRPSGRAGG